MRHLKKITELVEYENGVWTFDNYLKVHKILHGSNKGKIQFKINENDIWNKYSMIFGAALILDTKYVNIPEIREITLGLFRKVQQNSIESILNLFLMKMGYDDSAPAGLRWFITKRIFPVFEVKIKHIPINANNLGDIFNELEKIKNEVFEYQKDEYEKWKLQKIEDQYNV